MPLSALTLAGLAGAGYVLATQKRVVPLNPDDDERMFQTPSINDKPRALPEGVLRGKDVAPLQVAGSIVGAGLMLAGMVKAATGTAVTTTLATATGLSGAALGLLVIAIAVIITNVVFIIGNLIAEMNNLAKGRDGYFADMTALASAVYERALPVMRGTMPEVHAQAAARATAFCIVRGFNRAALAWVLGVVQGAAGKIGGARPEEHIGYWADRALCLPEAYYITNAPALPTWVFGGSMTFHTIESLYCNPSFDKLVTGLGQYWNRELEDTADYCGRALKTNQQVGFGIFGGPLDVTTAVAIGMIGQHSQVLLDEARAIIGPDDSYVRDAHGASRLTWYPKESNTTGKLVLR